MIQAGGTFQELYNHPWRTSVGIHLGVLVLVGLFLIPKAKEEKIDFDVIDHPQVSAAAKPVELKSKPKAPVQDEKKAVFGLSRKALVNESDSSAPTVKAGNTVAKDPDHKKLNADDPDTLPVPVDEYLVSAMPKLKNEYRIPYPAQAKKEHIEGPVIMDLLVDAAGRVRDVSLVSGPGHGLNEAALDAVRKFEFQAAEVQGKPVAVRMRYSYRFVLNQ